MSLHITPATLPPGHIGTPYSQQLTVVGGSNPGQVYTFNLASGGLPNGLGLSSSGLISGTPEDHDGLYSFAVNALGHDANDSVTQSMSISLG